MYIQSRARLCLAKCPAKYIGKYRQRYRRLRIRLYRQLHRQLHNKLNLALYPDLDTSLFGALLKQLLESLFRQLFATLFGSLFDSKYGELQASSRLALYRQMLPPRQPLGRPLHGRIVVSGRHHTICCGRLAAPICNLKVLLCRGARPSVATSGNGSAG